MIDPTLTQRAFTAILEHFVATGRAPHYAELADTLDIGSEEAREVQRAAVEAAPLASCWLAHDTDYIESWAPFSNTAVRSRGLLIPRSQVRSLPGPS
jgi:hypothetical protein